MLELLICSLVTILPDYLFRRYGQGKRIGREITLFSVWYELRWGITSCLVLTVALITLIFYYHPSTTNAASIFRTVPILPEAGGRVAEVFVDPSDDVTAGELLFRLDDSRQRAAVETQRRRIAEIDAAMAVARADLGAAEGQLRQAQGALRQAVEELDTKSELFRRNPNAIPAREIEDLETLVEQREGAVDAATAAREAARARLVTLLPAQRESAEAALAEAEVALDKTVVRASVDGRVEQFALRPGDVVTALGRPAGVLIPAGEGRDALFAGFNQIEAQVLRPGMIAEATCPAIPLDIVPLVVVAVQDYVADGQFNVGQQLLDVEDFGVGGAILARFRPLHEGGLDRLPPGAGCIVNVYSNHHAVLQSGEVGGPRAVFLHVVDTVGIVHASLLRIQALLLPVTTLVLGEH